MSSDRPDVVILLPGLPRASGGHRTILRNARELTSQGARAVCHVEPWHGDRRSLASVADELLPGWDLPLEIGFPEQSSCRSIVATGWRTAGPALACRGPSDRVYFVQDAEHLFYPVGAEAIAAARTYDAPFRFVTIGRWLTHLLATEFDVRAAPVVFGVDSDRYRGGPPANRLDPPSVCAVVQPDKPRRLSSLVVASLAEVVARRPELSVQLVGFSEPIEAPGVLEPVGILDEDELALLYQEASVGVIASATNPSRMSFEMMASGLSVVDVYGYSTVFDYPPDSITLAVPSVRSLAAAIGQALDVAADSGAHGPPPSLASRDEEAADFARLVLDPAAHAERAATPIMAFDHEPVVHPDDLTEGAGRMVERIRRRSAAVADSTSSGQPGAGVPEQGWPAR